MAPFIVIYRIHVHLHSKVFIAPKYIKQRINDNYEIKNLNKLYRQNYFKIIKYFQRFI